MTMPRRTRSMTDAAPTSAPCAAGDAAAGGGCAFGAPPGNVGNAACASPGANAEESGESTRPRNAAAMEVRTAGIVPRLRARDLPPASQDARLRRLVGWVGG